MGTLALLGAGLMYIIKRVGSAMRGSHNETFSAWLTWQELNNAEKIYAAKLYLNNQCGHVTSKFMQIFQPGKVKKLAGVKEK